MKAVEVDGKRLCLLRNPWGEGEWTGPWSDGSKEWTPEWMQKLNHRFGDDGKDDINFIFQHVSEVLNHLYRSPVLCLTAPG